MRQQFLIVLVAVLVCISVEVVVNPIHARKHPTGNGDSIVLGSLPTLQALNCTPSLGGKKHGSGRMEMVSRFGACSKYKAGTNFSFEHIFEHDRLRADSWISKLTNSSTNGSAVRAASSLPSHSSLLELGEYNYYVTVGLGTPKVDLSLSFDTGSGLTWTQCKPCSIAGSGSCHKQVDPIFDPAASSTYSKVSCSSSACFSFLSDPLCLVSSDSCAYNQTYLDESFTAGFLATETLSLTPTDALTGFYFGCGEQNVGLFGGSAGILGLDLTAVSIVSQASSIYGNYFSYCMPALLSNSTGHLTFGKGGTTSTSINYTPLITNTLIPNAYFLELTSIWVAGNDLKISPVVFSDPGTIIDSGTTLTYLPPEAYSALLDAFTEFMDAQNYPSFPSPYTTIEGCYNLTGVADPVIPTIKLFFNGGAQMNLHTWGIIFWIPNTAGRREVCLAFASNGGTSGLSILGNLQQETFDIVYDIDGSRIGFGANGC